ncbi:MAG: RNA polymerase sigma factor [Lachnospiraceae bacterium]|nr:RNA polymerase sigma factor [Lachnospiraceae bacterium]
MNEQQFENAVSRMVQGDKGGLKEIYEAYLGYIYRIVYEILQNKENAEDVTSEFFIKLWDKAEQFKPGGGHKGYLATMARNMAIDFIRKHRREELTALLQDTQAAPEEEEKGRTQLYKDAVTDELEQNVIQEMTVQEALAKLKPAERQIVSMKVLGELTFKEIAQIMEIPMGTVTWKYQNAIKKLRRCGYE